jgi:hypothetical protein
LIRGQFAKAVHLSRRAGEVTVSELTSQYSRSRWRLQFHSARADIVGIQRVTRADIERAVAVIKAAEAQISRHLR